MLLESLLEELGKRGIRTLFLEVSDANRAAQNLYEKLGFERIGLRETLLLRWDLCVGVE